MMSRPSLDKLLVSKKLQEVLPDLGSRLYIEHFYKCNKDKQHIYPREKSDVIQQLIAVGLSLDHHEMSAEIWQNEYKKQEITPIRYLLIRLLDSDCPGFPSRIRFSAPKATHGRNAIGSTADYKPFQSILQFCQNAELPPIGREEFEYLYYMILCKIQELYSNLQVRYINNFLEMDQVLHDLGQDCLKTSTPFTAENMKCLLFSAWHMLHDKTFTTILNNEIIERKFKNLMPSFIEPALRLDRRLDTFSPASGSPIDVSLIRKTIIGLQDTTNPFNLLDKFYRRYEAEPNRNSNNENEGKLERLSKPQLAAVQAEAAELMNEMKRERITGPQGFSVSTIHPQKSDELTVHGIHSEASVIRAKKRAINMKASAVNVPNLEAKAETAGTAKPAKPVPSSTNTGDLDCECDVDCECKFICDDIQGRCICAHRKHFRLKCKCSAHCDCKFVCNKLDNNCICVYRETPLGESAKKQPLPLLQTHAPPTSRSDQAHDVSIPPELEVLHDACQLPSTTSCPSESQDERDRLQSTALAVSQFPVWRRRRNSPHSTPGERKPTPPPKSLYRSKTTTEKSDHQRVALPDNQASSSDLHRVPFGSGMFFGTSSNQANAATLDQLPKQATQYRHPGQKRYVSAGGNLPLDKRASIPAPMLAGDGTGLSNVQFVEHFDRTNLQPQNTEPSPEKMKKSPRKSLGEKVHGSKLLNRMFKRK